MRCGTDRALRARMLRFASFCLLGALAAACTDAATEDEFAVENTTEIDESKADLGGTYTYYTVTPDYRRCASPWCGGYWVERVNRSTTKCHDGVFAERCYVAEIDWTKLELADDTIARVRDAIHGPSVVVRGTVAAKSFGPEIGRLGQFRATEAWLGQGPHAPSGPMVKVDEIGTRCIASPCPTFREKKLNDSATASLAELGWEHAGVDDEQIGDAINEIFEHELLLAGDRFTVTGPAGRGKARTVTQFYKRARDEQRCHVGGCSGQVCSDDPGIITTCEWRPEYACYADATCERQPGGACGWTPTDELAACLANPPSGE